MAPSYPFFSRFPFHRHEQIRSPPPISPPPLPTQSKAIQTKIRCLIILLFSPLILPLLFLTFPLVVAIGLCLWIRFCFRRRNRRRRRRRLVSKKKSPKEDAEAELRWCEEGLKEVVEDEREEEEDGEIGRLLQVYLEDQLRLAKSIVSGDATESSGGGGGGGGGGEGGIRNRRDDVDSNTVPLLT